MDAVVRRLLQDSALSTPLPHQCLPGAVDAEEIQTAADLQESARRMETGHQPVPDLVRALAVGSQVLVKRMRRAGDARVSRRDSVGARGVIPPGPPDRRGLRGRTSKVRLHPGYGEGERAQATQWEIPGCFHVRDARSIAGESSATPTEQADASARAIDSGVIRATENAGRSLTRIDYTCGPVLPARVPRCCARSWTICAGWAC